MQYFFSRHPGCHRCRCQKPPDSRAENRHFPGSDGPPLLREYLCPSRRRHHTQSLETSEPVHTGPLFLNPKLWRAESDPPRLHMQGARYRSDRQWAPAVSAVWPRAHHASYSRADHFRKPWSPVEQLPDSEAGSQGPLSDQRHSRSPAAVSNLSSDGSRRDPSAVCCALRLPRSRFPYLTGGMYGRSQKTGAGKRDGSGYDEAPAQILPAEWCGG